MKAVISVVVLVCVNVCLTSPQLQAGIQRCLDCICVAATDCNRFYCEGETCGPFAITWAYWADAGKLNETSDGAPLDFAGCANDKYCSRQTVFQYMSKYSQDCNNDGKVDCDDYILIHYNGGAGCKGGNLKEPHLSRYTQCVKQRLG